MLLASAALPSRRVLSIRAGWRRGREAEGTRLLNEHTPQGYRGFESLRLRQLPLHSSPQTSIKASNMAMAMVLRRMKVDVTPHGFRSTFRTWVAEHTHFPNEVAEAALAHTQADKVVAAYQRGDLFATRREMMAPWAQAGVGDN